MFLNYDYKEMNSNDYYQYFKMKPIHLKVLEMFIDIF